MLDNPHLDTGTLRVSLGHVAEVNRLFGGLRSVERHLAYVGRTVSLEGADHLSLLDVGVGNADAPRRLARRLSRKGVRLHWTGVDVSAGVLAVARESRPGRDGERLVQGDARQLPFHDRSFDVATAILTLHHFREGEDVHVLSEMARVARHAVIVSDLERHPVHYLGARFLAATRWRRDPVTRHDAPLSVLRSFTAEDLAELGRRAPFRSVTVTRHLPFRLVLEGRP